VSLLETIKIDALAARKAKTPVAGLLVTLIGEAETRMKTFSPARPMTDEEVLAVVRKFLKNLDETLRVLTPQVGPAGKAQAALDKAMAEKTALEAYLPKQLSADEIADFARSRIAEGAALGAIMASLKAEHGGRYDGKMASDVVKSLLAA
jgi:uncharacterized protein